MCNFRINLQLVSGFVVHNSCTFIEILRILQYSCSFTNNHHFGVAFWRLIPLLFLYSGIYGLMTHPEHSLDVCFIEIRPILTSVSL